MSWISLGLESTPVVCFTSSEEEWNEASVALNSEVGENEDITSPPPVEEIRSEQQEDAMSLLSGATILSSVPTSTSSNLIVPVPMVMASSPREVEDPPRGILAMSRGGGGLSISTLDSSFITRATDFSASSPITPLTFHPASISSSFMSDWASLSMVSQRSDEISSVWVRPEDFGTPSPTENHELVAVQDPRIWYSTLSTDEDWDAFRDAALKILVALEDPELDNLLSPDELLARLIAAEEEMLWKRQEKRGLHNNWLIMSEVALALLTATAASVGVRLLRG
jgi:hypothetical protein